MKQFIHEFKQDFSDYYRLLAISITAALLLILNLHFDKIVSSTDFIKSMWGPFDGKLHSFYYSVSWVSNCLLFYLVIPLVLIFTVFRKKPTTFGLGFGNLNKYLLPITICIAVMLPILFIAAGTPAFQNTYPMMRVPIFKYIIIWEFLYLLQFIAVEVLFRGFLLQPFCERFGAAGILFHLAPYCLIHLYKPLPEAIGSIFAGLLLGYIAYKSKSIWGGVIIHGSVAILMDIFSLMRM